MHAMNQEQTSCENYEWNASRKLWHLVGCLLMVVIFHLWKDIHRPVSGIDVLLVFAWVETAFALSIDILRFYSPLRNQNVKNLPFYGKLMRPIEENHFNATTYYLLAASILLTCYRIGWCRDTTFTMAITVLGVADPAAAWVRYQFAKRGIGREREVGLLTFIAASFAVMWAVRWLFDSSLSLECLLCVAIIVALIESYTKYWVNLIHPLTRRLQRLFSHHATLWLLRFYPDDNLLIPLASAVLVGVFRNLT